MSSGWHVRMVREKGGTRLGRRMKRGRRSIEGRCANQTMLVWFVDLCVPTRLTR